MNKLEIYGDYRNGCVDDVRLNGRALPLPPGSNVTQWGQATLALNLEYGCEYSSECNFIICPEPVKCSDKLRQSNCMCSDARVLASSSKDCTPSTCAKMSCINSKQCMHQNPKFLYNCMCPHGETGMNCKFLGSGFEDGLGVWTFTVVPLIIILILVLVATFIGYKYLSSHKRKPKIQDGIQQENVMNCGAEEESKNGPSAGTKLLMLPVSATDTTVSMELHTLKLSSGSSMKCLITYKTKIDTELHSENQDQLNVYYYEGGGTASSSFSSLCAGFQENDHEVVNLAPRKTLCILLEKQCQTES